MTAITQKEEKESQVKELAQGCSLDRGARNYPQGVQLPPMFRGKPILP